jgi:microcystin-dependent protein
MAETSVINPSPQFPLPIFIPENWAYDSGVIGGGSQSVITETFTGQITFFTGSSPPTGWLWCDGASYDTTTYYSLFGFLGYSYGGSGSNFNVPNCFGRVPYGADNTQVLTTTYSTTVSSGGNKNISVNQLASHNHSISISPTFAGLYPPASNNGANAGFPLPSGPDSWKNFTGQSTSTMVVSMANSGSGDDWLPPFTTLKYIIKA